MCIEQTLRLARPAKTTFAAIAEAYIEIRQLSRRLCNVPIAALLTGAGDREI